MDPERLLSRYFYEMLTDEESCQLQAWLDENPSHVEKLVVESFVQQSLHELFYGNEVEGNLRQGPIDVDIFSDSVSDSGVWEALLQVERTSPAIERVLDAPQADLTQKDKTANKPAPIGKFWPLMALLSSVAALLLVILVISGYLWNHRVVATLGETAHAQWAQAPDTNELRPGWLVLQQGMARLIFAKGAEVLIQAPCEFQLNASNRMTCLVGSLTAEVPERAKGFVVETPSSHITDYGTAFGVFVDTQLQSEVQVFEGEIGIRSPIKGLRTQEARLSKGQNARSDRVAGVKVGKARRRANQYMRDLPDPNQIGIPGQQLNLADVVGGGNGFGTGKLGGYDDSAVGTINPLTGQPNDPRHKEFGPSDAWPEEAPRYDFQSRMGDGTYHPVASLPYVDGVFVPDGSRGPCTVTTMGHLFGACPDTTGRFHWHIVNGWRWRQHPPLLAEQRGLNNKELAEIPCILLQANLGITFDLDRIRDDLVDLRIDRFIAQGGIPASVTPEADRADFWILVDGRVVFAKHELRFGEMVDIAISLALDDRFLTLVTTTSSETEGRAGISNWCIFQNPILELNRL